VAHVFCEPGSPIDKLAYDLKSKAPAEQQEVLFHVWSNDLANYRAKEVRHARRNNDLVAEGQRLNGAVLVICPFPVLRVTEFEGRLPLVEVEDIGDNDTTRRAGEGMLLHVLMTNLSTRDDL